MASWTKRFEEQRLAGLYSRHRGQVATVLTQQLEARILDATRSGPKDGTTHWSTRLMRYIRHYNKAPRTVKWKYSDTSRRLGTHSAVTGR